MSCSVVETFGEPGKAQDLDQVLRLEYRSKLLNPKWAKAGPSTAAHAGHSMHSVAQHAVGSIQC